jgi:MscS family membrane protein
MLLLNFWTLALLPFLQTSGLLMLATTIAALGFFALPKLTELLIQRLQSSQLATSYQQMVEPDFPLFRLGFGLIIADVLLLLLQQFTSASLLEFPLSLSIVGLACYLGIRIVNKFYLQNIEKSVGAGRKLDIEFFIVSRTLVILALIFVVVTVFAATHDINIFALLASLGVGGVAIAFAAQKVLEQFIGGIVLYFDSPFAIDDYIKLSDGTFGRVESIGLRLTKIRTSGKGTLVSVPNNLLVEQNIENFTNAGKIMAIVNLKFPQGADIEEQALIRQILIAGFKDLTGIDPNSTSVNFLTLDSARATRCQISFCAFSSSNEQSMDLRREILKAAGNKIQQKLQDFNIIYELEQAPDSVNLPISI